MAVALGRQDRILTAVVYLFLSLVLLLVAYPLYFVVIASVSDPTLVNTGRVWIVPRGFSLLGYEKILHHEAILRGYRNSLLYMVGGCSDEGDPLIRRQA